MRWTALATTVLTLCAASGSALAQQAKPAWYSGFEEGFPGEWLDYDDGSFSPSGSASSSQAEAWTIMQGGDLVFAGKHVYKGWPIKAKSDSHRAYPVIHVDIPTPLVNSFMVYLDVDYSEMSGTDWVHFATWGNNPDWAVHTLSVRDRKLEMAHLNWKYIGPGTQPEFPLRRWVRMTAYIHYKGGEGYIRLWQDGVPMLEGTYTEASGKNLMRAHWGWYSNGEITRGAQYNDEIQIWTLDAPLTNLEDEPASPYPSPANGSGGASGGASSGEEGGASSGGASSAGGPSAGGSGPGGAASTAGGAGDTNTAGRAGAPQSGGASGTTTAGRGGQASAATGGFATGGSSGSSGADGRAGSATAALAGTSPLPDAGAPSPDGEAGCAMPGHTRSKTAWFSSGALLALGSVLRRARRTRRS